MMRKLRALLLLLLLPCCYAAPDLRTAADAPDHSPAVVFLATLDYVCSAVVVEPDVLVTAGHCLDAEEYHVSGYGQTARGHRYWVSDSADIGVIRLEHPLRGVERARIADLPGPFEDAWVRGYGCARHEPGGGHLRQDTRPVVAFGGVNSNAQSGFMGEICHGDSGGAYFDAAGRLIGIVSLGYGDDGSGHATAGSAVPIAEALDGLLRL